MRKISVAVVGTLAAATFLFACKSTDETAPDASAVVVPVPTPDPALVNDASAAPVIIPPVTPTPVTPVPGTTPKLDAGTATDAGASTDAGAATDAGAKADAGASTGNLANCRANCLATLASCVAPQAGKDGGLPTFPDANKCKATSDTCLAACK